VGSECGRGPTMQDEQRAGVLVIGGGDGGKQA
jgi:hypothetical protein